jgi:hypothetical protein
MGFDTRPSKAPGSSIIQLTTQRRRKRKQVIRACDGCRLQRVKCDYNLPCSNCKRRGQNCSNVDFTQASTIVQASREVKCLQEKVQMLEQALEAERRKATQLEHQYPILEYALAAPFSLLESLYSNDENLAEDPPAGILIRTPRSKYKVWYGPSSLFCFIRQISDYLKTALKQPCTPDSLLPVSTTSEQDIFTAGPRESLSIGDKANNKGIIIGPNYLTSIQEEYFLDLFWQSHYVSLFPIVRENEFKENYRLLWTGPREGRYASALVDIILAICLQSDMSFSSTESLEQKEETTDVTVAGKWHYRRCQTLLGQESESPTISTLQCQLLCVVYLCRGSLQNMSDSAMALAVRTAYMLGLHLEPPLNIPEEERELRRRLWWALYVLDCKVGMKLGRPSLLYQCNTMPSLPSDSAENASSSGSTYAPIGENTTWLSYNLQNTKLFLEVRAVQATFYEKDGVQCNAGVAWENPKVLEAHMDLMDLHSKRIDIWINGVPKSLKTKRKNHGQPISVDCSPLELEQYVPLWLHRQRLLLELTYHHLSTSTYRPFINLNHTLTKHPREENFAARCALHSIALTHITHQIVSLTSILDGCNEVFQFQWNASITLAGFLLAYPKSSSAIAAQNALRISASVFDIYGKHFSMAPSAANIVRSLIKKIDFLVQDDQTSPPSPQESLDNGPMFGGPTYIAELNIDWFDQAVSVDLCENLDSFWPSNVL